MRLPWNVPAAVSRVGGDALAGRGDRGESKPISLVPAFVITSLPISNLSTGV